MARGQGAAGDRGTAPPLRGAAAEPDAAPRAGTDAVVPAAVRFWVAVHDLAQARAALDAAAELGLAVELVTAPGLAAFAGVGFCVALERALGHPLWIDVAEAPGTALAALRAGARRLLVAAAPAARSKLEDVARQLGARLLAGPPVPLLRLAAGEDPRPALRRALAATRPADPSSAAGERL
ncbi:MAG: hypothetical protein KatS3mg117_1941 [Geminicoccaceae bacterium]|nr:MAG: hypothetical protein KatS3mg117_1941 [Geminicoccaceae bacterium]